MESHKLYVERIDTVTGNRFVNFSDVSEGILEIGLQMIITNRVMSLIIIFRLKDLWHKKLLEFGGADLTHYFW